MLKLAVIALTVVPIAGTASLATVISPVEADAPCVLAKGDRLDLRPLGSQCSERPWSYYEARCLRDGSQRGGKAREVRLVIAGQVYQ